MSCNRHSPLCRSSRLEQPISQSRNCNPFYVHLTTNKMKAKKLTANPTYGDYQPTKKMPEYTTPNPHKLINIQLGKTKKGKRSCSINATTSQHKAINRQGQNKKRPHRTTNNNKGRDNRMGREWIEQYANSSQFADRKSVV